jgi:hypothetical protein
MPAITTVPTATVDRTTGARRWGRIIALVFLVILGLGALAGGITLMSAPDGSGMGFDLALLAAGPFPDYLVPGLILAGLFGVGSLAVAVLGVRDLPAAPFLAFGIGCAQMIWIVLELLIIGEFSFLHPTFFLVGLIVAAAAAVWGWPTLQAWRATRALRLGGAGAVGDMLRRIVTAAAASPSAARRATIRDRRVRMAAPLLGRSEAAERKALRASTTSAVRSDCGLWPARSMIRRRASGMLAASWA